jgi:hypothetical protein
VVKKVKRSDSESVSDYIATYTSDTAKMYKYSEGDAICVIVTPVVESKDETLQFTYKAVPKKKLVLLNGISFDREY